MIKKAFSRDQRGFTIVELLIALSVFSVMLLITGGVILELSRQFYRTVVQTRTQDVSRSVVEEIANNIKYSSQPPYQLEENGDVNGWCISGRRYLYRLGQQQPDDIPNALVRASSCSEGVPSDLSIEGGSPEGGTELLGDNMRITDFTVNQGASNRVFYIEITVAHGDDDVFTEDTLDSSRPECKPSRTDSTFCAVSTISTTVVRKMRL